MLGDESRGRPPPSRARRPGLPRPRRRRSSRRTAPTETEIVEVARVPITIGGLARHNVANALAAAGGARGLGATIAQVRDGLAAFAPDAAKSPGRLNLFRLGARVVIVDFAHNEAGVGAVLDVAEGIAGGAAGRAAPITAIIGTAGDRPDDTLRGIGRIAAERAQRVAIKQTLRYLRGRTAESVVGELMVGIVAGGGVAGRRPDLRLRDRRAPGRAERGGRRRRPRRPGRRRAGHRADVPRGPRPGCSSCSRRWARGRSTSPRSSRPSCRASRGARGAP